MAAVREVFEERIISRGLWPPRSPDISFCDFSPSGNLKGKVYKNNPHSTEALQNDITCHFSQAWIHMTSWELASQDIYDKTCGYIFCKFLSLQKF
jgi:hypothetical protein